jgi:hypothetical protein
MGHILTSDDLIQRPPDKFWDGHPTRKEMQAAFNKIGQNQAEIMGMLDTFDLVLNFVCEKLNVTRGELDAFVTKKAEEVKAWRAAQEAKAQENNNAVQGPQEGQESKIPVAEAQ